jgi:hypothetical protein
LRSADHLIEDTSSARHLLMRRGKTLKTADGRVIEYDVFGAKAARNLYFHDFLGGRRTADAGGKGGTAVNRAGYRCLTRRVWRLQPATRTGARAMR